VSFWAELFLGVIALATLTMAAIQVAVIVYGWSVARRVERLLTQVDQQMAPLTQNINAIARDAARISSMAVGQMERADKLVTDLAERIEHTSTTVQNAILRPLRDGAALLAGFRAALGVIREFTGRPGSGTGTRSEDEDPLFIG
jgi:hypothetical protein